MSNVQHTYYGHGDPNNNPDLALTGDAIGLHHYLDKETGAIWMSRTIGEDHDDWVLIYGESGEPQPA